MVHLTVTTRHESWFVSCRFIRQTIRQVSQRPFGGVSLREAASPRYSATASRAPPTPHSAPHLRQITSPGYSTTQQVGVARPAEGHHSQPRYSSRGQPPTPHSTPHTSFKRPPGYSTTLPGSGCRPAGEASASPHLAPPPCGRPQRLIAPHLRQLTRAG